MVYLDRLAFSHMFQSRYAFFFFQLLPLCFLGCSLAQPRPPVIVPAHYLLRSLFSFSMFCLFTIYRLCSTFHVALACCFLFFLPESCNVLITIGTKLGLVYSTCNITVQHIYLPFLMRGQTKADT